MGPLSNPVVGVAEEQRSVNIAQTLTGEPWAESELGFGFWC